MKNSDIRKICISFVWFALTFNAVYQTIFKKSKIGQERAQFQRVKASLSDFCPPAKFVLKQV